MIDLSCPSCGEPLSVPGSLAGQTETCPACGKEVLIPSGQMQGTAQALGATGAKAEAAEDHPVRMDEDWAFFECDVPAGDGLCSDNDCPCSEVTIRRGEGYLYIDDKLVEFRKKHPTLQSARQAMRDMQEKMRAGGGLFIGAYRLGPILVCEEGSKLRGLDLEVAAADAQRWWATGQVPLRATPPAKEACAKTESPSEPGTVLHQSARPEITSRDDDDDDLADRDQDETEEEHQSESPAVTTSGQTSGNPQHIAKFREVVFSLVQKSLALMPQVPPEGQDAALDLLFRKQFRKQHERRAIEVARRCLTEGMEHLPGSELNLAESGLVRMRMASLAGRPLASLAGSGAFDEWQLGAEREWARARQELGERPNLSEGDCSHLVLSGFDFTNTDLVGANFERCVLVLCRFDGANLAGACFRGACISATSAQNCCLRNANFSGADLDGFIADTNTDLDGVNFTNCTIKDSDKLRGLLSREQRKQLKIKNKCFIATAACATSNAPDVVRLQELRDTLLQQTAYGRGLVKLYELVSPPIAWCIARSSPLRYLVRHAIVRPAARLAAELVSRYADRMEHVD